MKKFLISLLLVCICPALAAQKIDTTFCDASLSEVLRHLNRSQSRYVINFMYDGKAAKTNMEYIMGPMPVKPGIEALDPEYRNKIVLSDELISKGQRLMPIDDDPAVKKLYDDAWDRIKATK